MTTQALPFGSRSIRRFHYVVGSLAVAAFCLAISGSAVGDDAVRADESLVVMRGDVKLDVAIRGQGPAVVFVPSLGRSVHDFDDLATRLAEGGFRVVLPEPRGIGNSSGPLSDMTLHDLAADVAAIIRQTGAAPAVVVGHAFGNRVARTVASDHPELVKSVVLIACGGAVPIRPEISQALRDCFRADLSEEDRLRAIKLAFFAEGNDAGVWKEGWHAEAGAAQSAATRRTPVEEWWQGGSAPILVLQGEQDTVAPVENARRLKEVGGDRVTIVSIANAGHALLPEQPERIAEAVLTFLTQPDGGAPRSESERQALAAVDEFLEAFNARDPQRWAASLNYPHVRLAGNEVRIWQTADDYAAEFKFAEFAARTGWQRSRYASTQIVQSGEEKVHVAVEFTRLREDGSAIGTYAALYVVTKQGDHWGIQARSSFAP